MAQELTKQQPQDGQIETWRHLYKAAWEQAFNEFMFLMAEQYSLELLVEVGREQVPSPMVKFWRESLQDISPLQMREGLRGYMASDRRHFKPTPEDIKENALDVDATDKPKRITQRDCPMCAGTSWRDAKGRKWAELNGSNATGMVRCYCSVVVYAGQEFHALPASLPPVCDESVEKELAELKSMVPKKAMLREMTDEELEDRREKLRQQAEMLKKNL